MKSIFSKVLVISLVIILIGFVILAYGLNIAYKNYIIEANKKNMIENALKFERIIEEQTEQRRISILKDAFYKEIDRLSQYADLKVWMILPPDYLLVADDNNDIELIKKDLNYSEIKKIIKEKVPVYRESNYTSYHDNKYYTLIYPISINGVDYVLFLNKSVPNLNKTISEINNFSVTTIILFSLYVSLTIFFLGKRFTLDIINLNRIVKYVSDGNYDYILNTDREDEIGELCRNLNSMTKELKGIEESRRKFISDLTHDLRSPVTSIKGYATGILDGTIPKDKWDKYLNVIVDESNRLTKLINDMLDLSKMQSGHLKIERGVFEINSLILNVLDKFEQRLLIKNVNVDVRLYNGELYVEGDINLLERVVYNLVDNAVKFVNDNGNIELKTTIKDNKVLVGIRNSGTLIPKDKLDLIWERFAKLDLSRGMEKKSSGLGLSIVKEIIDMHNEKIDVYSSEKLGTMFVFSLEKTKKNCVK